MLECIEFVTAVDGIGLDAILEKMRRGLREDRLLRARLYYALGAISQGVREDENANVR